MVDRTAFILGGEEVALVRLDERRMQPSPSMHVLVDKGLASATSPSKMSFAPILSLRAKKTDGRPGADDGRGPL